MGTEEKKVGRREFLQRFGVVGAFIASMLVFWRDIVLYLFPPKKRKSYHKYLVARKSELKIGEARRITLGKFPVFIVRLKDGFKVYSGVCTHLGCIVKWEKDKERFYCPCHKGVFDITGKVISGPPPKPLNEYRVEEKGQLVYIYVEDKLRSPWA
jgi:cytochrome b6-f complex iron-sulfur subunit